jgi:4'-phosphopantetheinyl transferase
MNPGSIQIHLIAPAEIPLGVAMECLIDEEKLRAARFHFAHDAAHWAACRAALRQILARETGIAPREVPLVYSEFGKPVLAAPFGRLQFNLSHCPDLAILALSDSGPVGVDLESLERAPDLLECVDSFCHPEEIASLPHGSEERSVQLLHLWTAKEAVLKSLGTGMSHPPETVRIEFETHHATARSEVPLDGIERQVIRPLRHPKLCRHVAAVSARAGVQAVTFVDAHALSPSVCPT